MNKDSSILFLLSLVFFLTSCSYNPLSSQNRTTGSPVGLISGAAVGGVGAAALGGSKPWIGAAAVVGGVIGYYVTTERFDAGGIIEGGGKVYSVGQYVGIYIPADRIFEPNSAELRPEAAPILDSAADVLARYPNNNIIVSGSTSGIGHSSWQQRLSEQRAERVAAYLWNAGINEFKERSIQLRHLSYVGYGDYFPIASDTSNCGIRTNSRIQITSYPSCAELHLGKRVKTFPNIGSDDQRCPTCRPGGYKGE